MRSVLRNLCWGVFLATAGLVAASHAQLTDSSVHQPPSYSTFQPPATGGSYTEPVFGSSIKRVTNAPATQNLDRGGNLSFITDEYSSVSPFNLDGSKFLLIHQSYFGLYSGDGVFIKALSMDVSAESEPRWSRTDPNVLYYHQGNQLKKYDVSTDSTVVVHTFAEYSRINGEGESDISFDGDHFVLAGDNRFVFVYQLSTDSRGAALDAAGRRFDSLYITPNNNVTITWLQSGTSRYTGIEVFDQNMNFLRQLAHAGGHMDVTRDGADEVLVWTNSDDAQPLAGCNNGLVKIRIADGHQTCLASFDWSLAVHISGPDNSGYIFAETYAPSNPDPGSANWVPYANEILQVKLDGSEVRRLAHHRSRPFNSYTYMPRASVSHDGGRLLFNSNYDLQAILGYTAEYGDVYLLTVPGGPTSGGTGGGTGDNSGGGTPGATPGGTPAGTGGGTGNNPGGGTNDSGSTTGSTTTTRVEQNAAAVSYTGTWYANGGAGNSGSSASLAIDPGSRATFTFTGTAVRWIGYRDEWSGIANVYVDGKLQSTIDTYASPNQFQTVLYAASGLTANTHTLTIEATGTHSAASASSWVWIDAFDADNSTPTSAPPPPPPPPAIAPTPTSTADSRMEQDNPAAKYTGTWFSRSNTALSGGSAKLAMDKGSEVSFSFTGTGASWIGYKDAWSGVAVVYVDNSPVAEIDTYSPTDIAQAAVYTVNGLASGDHTLRIVVAQKKNASSGGMWVWVDAFSVKP